MIGIVDYGAGNLRSLEHALAALGWSSRRVSRPGALRRCSRLVLPGVGHFGAAAAALHSSGLAAALRAWVSSNRPLLGICLGLQLLFEASDEALGTTGLGVWPGRCRSFDSDCLKVPHMGWSSVHMTTGPEIPAAYFVHSYFVPTAAGPTHWNWRGSAHYGVEFLAAGQSGAVTGCQFHPEKSGPRGLDFLKEVLSW